MSLSGISLETETKGRKLLKNLGKIFISMILVFSVFLFNGCFLKKSTASQFLGITGYDVVVTNNEITLDVGEGDNLFDYTDKIVVSEKATYKLYVDERARTEVTDGTLAMGENIFYLKVTAETTTRSTTYKLIVLKDVFYTITYSSGSGYQIVSTNTDPLPVEIEKGGSFSFAVQLETGYNSTFTVKANNEILTSTNNTYTVSNVNTNTHIQVGNVSLINYDFNTEPNKVGYALLNLDNTPFNLDEVSYGSNVSFKVGALAGYDISNIIVKNNDTVLTATDGVYTINNVTQDVNITVTGAEVIKLDVTYPLLMNGYALENAPATVNYGDDFSLYIVIDEANGYNHESLVLKINNLLIEDYTYSEGVVTYTHVNVTEAIVVDISLSKHTYTLSVTEGDEYTVTFLNANGETIAKPTNVTYGENVYFKVVLLPQYSDSNIVVKNNETTLNASSEGVYNVGVAGNVNISVSGVELNSYTITYPDALGYELVAVSEGDDLPNEATHGSSFSFKVVIFEGYNTSNLVVKNNDTVLTASDGIYTVSNITANVNITVNGVELITYTVTYPTTQVGYTLTNPVNTVDYNGTFNLYIVIDEANGYNHETLVLKINNQVIPSENYTYESGTVTYVRINVMENLTVDITVEKDNYDVWASTGDGYAVNFVNVLGEPISQPESVVNGGSVYFKVVLDESYDGTLVVKNGSTEIVANEYEIYAITNIKADVNISVSGIKIKTFTITYVEAVGYTLIPTLGDTMPSQVNYVSSLSFKVSLLEGYETDGLQVFWNNNLIDANADDVYTIENITVDGIISVTGLTIKTYNVSVEFVEGATEEGDSIVLYYSEEQQYTLLRYTGD